MKGKIVVQELWNRINNAKDWVLDKIQGFFGIHSPSTLFNKELQKEIKELKDVVKQINLSEEKEDQNNSKEQNS